MKKLLASFFIICACAAAVVAHAETASQDTAGAAGQDTNSANASAKTAVGEPGVGQSRSANYIYDHGTWWADDSAASSGSSGGAQSAPASSGAGSGANAPIVGGSGSGSGGGTSAASAAEQEEVGVVGIGGVSPAVDTEESEIAAAEIPDAEERVVTRAELPRALEQAARAPRPKPRIIRVVDDGNTVEELAIVLYKRVMPWPVWFGIALIAAALGCAAAAIGWAARRALLLGGAGALAIVVIVGAIVVRSLYRFNDPVDPGVIATTTSIPREELGAKIRALTSELPLGGHAIAVRGEDGRMALQVTVYVKRVMPF